MLMLPFPIPKNVDVFLPSPDLSVGLFMRLNLLTYYIVVVSVVHMR